MSVLDTAKQMVDGDRQDEYGDPVENYVRQSLVLAGMGITLTPEQIVKVQMAQKYVRAGRGHKLDTTVDIAGYAEILQRVREATASGAIDLIVNDLLAWYNPPVQTAGIAVAVADRFSDAFKELLDKAQARGNE